MTDLPAAVAAITAAAGQPAADPARLLDALALLGRVQAELAALEPALIAAAREAGASWQAIAPALGVASRQAAERRYLRGTSAGTGRPGETRDARVRAERDRRAETRAVARWANDNTAELRRLAGQITALTDLGTAAAGPVGRLHDALGGPDASALPDLLAATHGHLDRHPGLAGQIDAVTARTDRVRRDNRRKNQSFESEGRRSAKPQAA